jgi:hypothetical protein
VRRRPGGGYTANAAINERRIKAVGTVSAVNIGSMFRNGWDNKIKSADAIPVLKNGSKARTAEASGAATVTVPLARFCLAPTPRMQARVSRALSRRDSRTQPRVSTLGTRRIIPNRPARGGRFEIARDINIISFNATSGTNPLLRPLRARRLMDTLPRGECVFSALGTEQLGRFRL